jgi:hypothetical protein
MNTIASYNASRKIISLMSALAGILLLVRAALPTR